MAPWLSATLWGLFAGSSLVLGALLGYYLKFSQRIISAIMAFGSGILISALSFELIEKAYKKGGFASTAVGFLGGALIYTFATLALSKFGAQKRKRSGEHQKLDSESKDNGTAIALGALLDGIPESIVIGLSLVSGKSVSMVAVIAIFISNVPEGLSSSNGMKEAGRSKKYIFGLWSGIAIMSGLASLCGYSFFGNLSINIISATTAVAGGAILSMIVDTMIPEAFEKEHEWAGLITVIGFLISFGISKLSS
jgi:ZIP family zinc transporter